MRILYFYQYLDCFYKATGMTHIKLKIYKGDFMYDWGFGDNHTYKGSLRRHLAIEKYLYQFHGWIINYDASGWYKLFRILLTILYGLNCNFPKLDILRFLIFQYKTKRLY